MNNKFFHLIMLLILFAGCASQQSMFNKTKMENSVEAYKEFLQKYPESAFAEEARYNLMELEFKNAERINTIEAFISYLNKYPKGAFSERAAESIDNLTHLELKKVREINTIDAYKTFIKKYQNSKYSSIAKQQMEPLVWSSVESEGTVDAYRSYLKEYPNGEYSHTAKQKYEPLLWESVKTTDTEYAYNSYLENYPNGTYAAEAKNNKRILSLIDDLSAYNESTAEIASRTLSSMGSRLTQSHIYKIISSMNNSTGRWVTSSYRRSHCTDYTYTTSKYYAARTLINMNSKYLNRNVISRARTAKYDGRYTRRVNDPGWI